jgi:hypothetical protein
MPPKQPKAKYFQKQEDDEESGDTPQTPIELEIKEKEGGERGIPAKKPRKPRASILETGIDVPAELVTVSKAEAKRLKIAEKGPYVMSEKQKANCERLKLLTAERTAKRRADAEGQKQLEAEKLAAKQKEEALILAKANRVKVNVVSKPKRKKVVAKPVEVAPVESEVESSQEEESEYESEPVKQKKKYVRKPKVPVDSESENTDAIIEKVKNIKSTIHQAQTGSILSKFF